MEQLNLFEMPSVTDKWQVQSFSADNFGQQSARMSLEQRLIPIMVVSNEFDRRSVSYQLSKNDCLHRWLKYKEGFSADMVKRLLKEFNIKAGDTILDPFVGSGTTSLVCKMQGINSIGFDILPMSKIAIEAKQSVFDYDLSEIKQLISEIKKINIPKNYNKHSPYITITDGAYPKNTEQEIAFFAEWNQNNNYSKTAKNLVTLCILNSLEKVSYTAKDGQFLRWDYRSKKMRESAEYREQNGKPPLVIRLDKGDLPTLKQSLLAELNSVFADISIIQKNSHPPESKLQFIEGNSLYELPKHDDNILNGVITSPPYCNRYDYTRTYALELAYLGVTNEKIKILRQALLSCTVENKPKIDHIKDNYTALGKEKDFKRIVQIIENNKTLAEINHSLTERNRNGDINNKGVLRMVNSYFTELTFIYAELFRLCKSGAKVAFVNDNVRYGGEVISVDFISTELAEQIGFKPVKVYSLKQQKGNSSQQMAKFGRVPLRKSITMWEKP
ncbi:MAG: site-specific DNA-methyltransferase [Planctomycetaceae bacterium]|jgi:site-specific DNA-methyltransferase (cytosine-N4-specific)|nr:site-specific DNA-methyltransferase [Planctomycetaceae bacterium]